MAFTLIQSSVKRRALKRRKPSRAVRRANSARPPRAAALALTKDIQARLTRFERVIERLLFPVLEDFAPREERALVVSRDDARIPRFVSARLEAIELNLIEIFDESELDKTLGVIGQRVATKNGAELRRVIGVAIRQADPGVAAMIEGFRLKNVGLIRSLAGQELVEITRILERSEAAGLRVETLRDQIRERFKVTKSRASLLARDQTLTLNSQIARTRQQNVGIAQYIWTTSGDDRVREVHSDLDGTIQRWDTPPVISDDGRTGHPGDDYQCRCTAFPVLPELA